jgi:hypothetical protein
VRTSARIFSPASPRPWNAYGELRGLYAPPRSSDAPAALAISAEASVCSAVSTAHGPAITVSVSGPIGTPATLITERSRRCSRLTSLYGAVIRTTSLTPGMPRRFSVSSWSMSPTRPTIVRETPRLTNASPPAPRTSSTTPLTSAAPASAAMTTTMSSASSHKKSPGPLARGSC